MDKKHLFVISSMYQLFNAINIIKQEKIFNCSSIILLESFSENKFSNEVNWEYLNQLIENAWIIKYQIVENKVLKMLYIVKNICSKKIFGECIEEKFEKIYITGTEIISKIVAYKMKSEDAKLFYFEDGFGSYNSVLDINTKIIKDKIIKLFWGKEPLRECRGIYVYEPNLINCNSLNIPVLKINKVRRNEMQGVDYKKLYVEMPFKLSKPFVFFNSWFENEKYYNFQNSMIEIIASNVGGNYFCVKPHPNEWKKVKLIDNVEYIEEKSSFEVSNYYNDFSKNIFISLYSTACLTPSLVYDDKVKIIFLYKIFEKVCDIDLCIDESMKKLTSEYEKENRIYFPESIEELKNIIEFLKKQIGI